MITPLLILFILQSLLIVRWLATKYYRLISFYSFFSFSFIGLVLIGFIQIVNDPFLLLEEDIVRALFFSILIQFLSFIAFIQKTKLFSSSLYNFLFPDVNSNLNKAFYIGLLYSVIGMFFFYKYYSLSGNTLLSIHSGIAVIYISFAKIVYVGYIIVLICALRSKQRTKLFAAIFIFVILLAILSFRLKRTETLILIASTIITLFYIKGIRLSYLILFSGGILFFIISSNIGELRQIITFSYLKNETLKAENIASSIFDTTHDKKTLNSPELRYAVSTISIIDNEFEFSLGAVHWNRLVSMFVPAQFVGRSVKEELYFSVPEYDVFSKYGVETFRTGLMGTVLLETFKEFWFLGCLFIYVLFNFIKGIVFNSKKLCNVYYLAFVALISPYAVVISGSGTALFLSQCIYFYIYLFPLRLIK